MPSHRGPVLVVEDDADIREALRDFLDCEGFDTAEASDGQAALAYLHANPPPPLILLDWNMAPMNGPEFLTELQREPACDAIPIALLTADARISEKTQNSRFVGCVKKPVDLDRLLEIVGRYCP